MNQRNRMAAARFIFLIFFILSMITTFGQWKFKPTEKYQKHSSRAFGYYEDKRFMQAALSYDTLFKLTKGKGLRSDKYNAACSWALAGNIEKAFSYLNQIAVSDKWSNLSHLLSDADLVSLHSDRRWQSLVDMVKSNKVKAEAKFIKPLVALLDTIYTEDQLERLMLDTIQKQFGFQSQQMDSLWNKINYQDSVNVVRVKNIIDTYGWLGPEEVGEQGALTIFSVIQHSDSLTQVTYIPKMREAVRKDKAQARHLALLEDRILIQQGKKQIYGSQIRRDEKTGKPELFPIMDEANVNNRRASVGLEPLEKYAKLFGIEYILPKSEKRKL